MPRHSARVDATPPDGAPFEDYLLAMAEAAAYNCRWIVTLDDSLARGIAQRDARATATWRRLAAAAAWLEAQSASWAEYTELAALGVISDFAGENEFLSTEFLNLATRANLLYRVVARPAADLRAVIYLDARPPAADLAAFARAGGIVIARETFGMVPPDAIPLHTQLPTYRAYKLGRGSLIVPAGKWDDPFQVAIDARLLLGHRHDIVRLYNATTTCVHCAQTPDKRRTIVHLLNYSKRPPSMEITLATPLPFTSARLLTPESETSLSPTASRNGMRELALPPFAAYAALLVG